MFERIILEDRIHDSGVRARQQQQQGAEGSHLQLQAPGRDYTLGIEHGLETWSLAPSNILPPARLRPPSLPSREQRKPWMNEVQDGSVLLTWAQPHKDQGLKSMGDGNSFPHVGEAWNWQSLPSSSGPSTSVYRWLITWIQKLASNCSSLLLDVYSLRLLAYKDLLPRLADFSLRCTWEDAKVLSCRRSRRSSFRAHTPYLILAFLYVCLSFFFSFPHCPESVAKTKPLGA